MAVGISICLQEMGVFRCLDEIWKVVGRLNMMVHLMGQGRAVGQNYPFTLVFSNMIHAHCEEFHHVTVYSYIFVFLWQIFFT